MPPNMRWRAVGGQPPPPEGIIFGIETSGTIQDGWSLWTDANNYYIKGTNSDSLVGTTAASSGQQSWNSGTDGSHTGGNTLNCALGGTNLGSPDILPSRDTAGVGGHSHTLYATPTPAANNIKLIRAGAGAKWVTGLLGFATSALADQELFSTFNGGAGHLKAATYTGTSSQAVSGFTSSASYNHDHLTNLDRQCTGSGTVYTSVGSSGPSHSHTYGPSLTMNLKRAMVRAYKVINEKKIEGLIGMWATSDPIPDGWELVTELNDHYVQCSTTGTGSESGNNTAVFSGTTGSSGHSHGYSGSTFSVSYPQHHNNTVSHSHNNGATKTWQPARFHVKFIRYVG